ANSENNFPDYCLENAHTTVKSADVRRERWHSSCTLFRMMRLRHLILCTIAGCFFVSPLIAAVEWQVIKINGRDFLSVDNIAKFYGFPDPTINGTNVDLNKGKNEMQFHLDSREMLINSVRNWLSYPVLIHHGNVVV